MKRIVNPLIESLPHKFLLSLPTLSRSLLPLPFPSSRLPGLGATVMVDEDGCNTVLVLRLGCPGEGRRRQRSRRESSVKSEPSVSNPVLSGLSLTLGLSDTAFRTSPDAEDTPSASFSNLKKETESGSEETDKTSARGSDDDGEGGTRKKLRLTKEQSALLEERFKENSTLNPQKQKVALARQLNLRPRQVEVWFQNRRARTKLKQTEVECEFLRRCCETLTEENRRLNREVQELKALKLSAMATPLYMPLPPAVLKVCPSCERLAGGGGDRSKDAFFMAAKPAVAAGKTLFLNPFTNSTAC